MNSSSFESAWRAVSGVVSGVEPIQDRRATVLQLHVDELLRQAEARKVRACSLPSAVVSVL